MNGKILIVEDEPEVRDYLTFALKRHGVHYRGCR